MSQDRNNKSSKQSQESREAGILAEIRRSRLFQILLTVVVMVLIVLVVIAFVQGRSINLGDLGIGALPTGIPTLTASVTPVTHLMENGMSDDDDVLLLDRLPFKAFAWSTAIVLSETGWANLIVINNASSEKMYFFEYTLPMTSTAYSGAGLTFEFDVPEDLTEYNQVSIDITFASQDTRCDLIFVDISSTEPKASVPLSPNILLNEDIERRRNGLRETFSIPLDTYFGNVNRKDIRQVSCAVDTEISPGNHAITINSIWFSK